MSTANGRSHWDSHHQFPRGADPVFYYHYYFLIIVCLLYFISLLYHYFFISFPLLQYRSSEEGRLLQVILTLSLCSSKQTLSLLSSIYASSSCYSRKFPVWSIQYSSVDYFSILIICLLNIYLISIAPLEMKGALESLSCVTKFRPLLIRCEHYAVTQTSSGGGSTWKWLSFLHGCTAIHWVANSCHGDTWTGLYVS